MMNNEVINATIYIFSIPVSTVTRSLNETILTRLIDR